MKCANCGKPSEGTWSEGGAKWALCEECFNLIFRDNPDDRLTSHSSGRQKDGAA